MSLTLYQVTFCPFVHKITGILIYKGIPYETVEVNLNSKAEIEFSRIKKVPIIDHNGNRVEDSVRIALYLDGKYPNPPLFPIQPRMQHLISKFESTLGEEIYPLVISLLFSEPHARQTYNFIKKQCNLPLMNKVFSGFTGISSLKKKLGLDFELLDYDAAVAALREHYTEWSRSLKQGDFLFGAQPSVADFTLYGFMQTQYQVITPLPPLIDEFPHLLAWYERLTTLLKDSKERKSIETQPQ